MSALHLTVSHYPTGGTPRCVETRSPLWEHVAAAIGNMDDNEFPIVQLSWKDVDSCFDDESSFNVIGGLAVGFALFEFIQGWQFEDPKGDDEDVRLWQSDQGYFCRRKNVIVKLSDVLELSKIYFATGSYEVVQDRCTAIGSGMSRL